MIIRITDDRVYGQQQGRAYNSHYGGYVFLPLYVYCGNHLLVSYLREVNRTDAHHSAAVLSLLVKGLRAHWPEVNIVFRGDAGFYTPLLLSWCERHDVQYIIGYRRNEVLLRDCQIAIDTLENGWHWLDQYDADIDSIKYYKDIPYQANSWCRCRRIVAKIEHNDIGANQRFVVTNLPGDAEQLYSEVYCERGTMENRHKELQMGLFADRTSCSHLVEQSASRDVLLTGLRTVAAHPKSRSCGHHPGQSPGLDITSEAHSDRSGSTERHAPNRAKAQQRDD